MQHKKCLLLALCLCSAIALLNAQEIPALPTETTSPAPAASDADFEKFPECRMYSVYTSSRGASNKSENREMIKELTSKIDDLTSVAAIYDKNAAKFDPKQNAGQDVQYGLIVWDGYLPIKKAGTYTFLVTCAKKYESYKGSFLYVNGKASLFFSYDGEIQYILDVEMKPGMNRLRFGMVARSYNDIITPAPQIRYKLQNVVGDFRDFTPANLFHKVETEDW